MATSSVDHSLHLPSLSVVGLRGVSGVKIARLGRVTLLSGKNGVGKTTLLDAVKIYAARGRPNVLAGLLRAREEIHRVSDEDGIDVTTTDWSALFYGRDMVAERTIGIGPFSGNQQLTVRCAWADRSEIGMAQPSLFPEDQVLVLRIEFAGQLQQVVPIDYPLVGMRRHRLPSLMSEFPTELGCETLGPGLPSNADMARFWDQVVLRDDETLAVEALNLVLETRVEGIAVIGDPMRRDTVRGRRVVVKVKGQTTPVPLQSLGDGAVRLFGVALALANSRDGFLVIDEVENGIHHSVQRDFWAMVMQTAHDKNVQVLATTHGWDCVVGFAKAATELEEVDGVLIRLEKDDETLRAVEYSEANLKAAARYGIEVR